MLTVIQANDIAYRNSIDNNKSGFVLNVMQRNLELHQAVCPKIAPFKKATKKSRTANASYKVCAGSVQGLKDWKQKHLSNRRDGFKGCEICKI